MEAIETELVSRAPLDPEEIGLADEEPVDVESSVEEDDPDADYLRAMDDQHRRDDARREGRGDSTHNHATHSRPLTTS